MNSTNIFPNIWRFIGLVATQAFILNDVSLTSQGYCNLLLYPLFVLFLPVQLATPAAVLLGFVAGITVDWLTGTPGVNAAAGAMSAYARAAVLHRNAPRGGGYTAKEPIASPVYFGWRWFLKISAIYFGVHVFWYFAMANFTPVYLLERIIPQSILSWCLSMVLAILYTRLFNPKI